jgi:hypothetical protein
MRSLNYEPAGFAHSSGQQNHQQPGPQPMVLPACASQLSAPRMSQALASLPAGSDALQPPTSQNASRCQQHYVPPQHEVDKRDRGAQKWPLPDAPRPLESMGHPKLEMHSARDEVGHDSPGWQGGDHSDGVEEDEGVGEDVQAPFHHCALLSCWRTSLRCMPLQGQCIDHASTALALCNRLLILRSTCLS